LARLNVHHGSPEPEPTVLRDDPGLQLRPNHFHGLPIRLADNLLPASRVLVPALACEFLHPGVNAAKSSAARIISSPVLTVNGG
jgi:hypothetical protein